MKQNIRKILAALVLAVTVLGLTACGAASADTSVELDKEYYQFVADFLISNWNNMPREQIAEYGTLDKEDAAGLLQENGIVFLSTEAFTTGFAGYEGSIDELGAYVSTDSYEEPEVKGDEVTFVTNLTYENRTAKLSIVFNKKGVAESVTVDPKYDILEILGKAGMNTLLGMGTI